ncbi:MAG: hypothetical protein R6X14_00760 [bacterium]
MNGTGKAIAAACVLLLVGVAPGVGRDLAPKVTVDAITIPRMLSYQGRLTDTLGIPVPDGEHSVVFRLYSTASGGSDFWNETRSVTTRDGLFAVLLGTVRTLRWMPDDGAVYLGMAVGGGAELVPRLRIVSAAYAYKADTASYALASPAVADNAWSRSSPSDSVLYTVNQLGIVRGGAGNALHGDNASKSTHINLGTASTTGASGLNRTCVTVSGGRNNSARNDYATIGGGRQNNAGGPDATVPGGYGNWASGSSSFACGNGTGAYGANSFTANLISIVGESFSNSAAFNSQHATASNQTRVGALSKASGTFTIDHPLDPHGRILNHYFIEGPEMRNIYDGEARLDESGRAVVNLPDYFDALNRNPRVQLTGVGSSDVHLAEKVSGNRFVIGGTPGIEVYWQVTGERQDVSAEATRRMMPVEQPKTGELAGTMLDDDFLVGCMDQLEREGKAQGIDFRTAAGRRRYERAIQLQREAESQQ